MGQGLTFYFDLGSPYAYLAAERLPAVFPAPVRWQPVSLGAIFKHTGRSSWALAGQTSRGAGMAEVERRARAYGLPAVRWPEPWPTNYLFAMRIATFAAAHGRGAEFALAAFRAAFQHGIDLAVTANVLALAGASGLDAAAAERTAAQPELKLALREATDEALARGVSGVPTVAVGEELFWGEDRLAEAAALVAPTRSA